MAEEAVSVRGQRVVAPNQEDLRYLVAFCVVAVREVLRAVNRVQITLQHLRGHHARNETGDAGKAIVHEVRAAEAEAQAAGRELNFDKEVIPLSLFFKMKNPESPTAKKAVIYSIYNDKMDDRL